LSFVGKIFGTAAGETVKGLAEGVGELALDLRSAITGDMRPETKAKLEELYEKSRQLSEQGQLAINEAEARHSSMFVAGWRPAIGWISALALGWHYVVYPFFLWVLVIKGSTMAPPPQLALEELWPIITGMLGLAAYRSYEKKHGVQKDH